MIHNLIIRLRDNSPADPCIQPEDLYQITVRGLADSTHLEGFCVKSLRSGGNRETLITAAFHGGPALRGFLKHLDNLHLIVLSVVKIDQKDNRR